jgi:hypothetical protein
MEHLFSPYKVIAHQKMIHLKESAGRIGFLVLFFRVLPLFLFAMGILIAQMKDPMPKLMVIPFGILIIGLSIAMFLHPIIFEVVIGKEGVVQRNLYLWFVEHKRYLSEDILAIRYRVEYGRGGGLFYTLQLRHGKSVALLTIPVIYMKEENLDKINEVLIHTTGKEVVKE